MHGPRHLTPVAAPSQPPCRSATGDLTAELAVTAWWNVTAGGRSTGGYGVSETRPLRARPRLRRCRVLPAHTRLLTRQGGGCRGARGQGPDAAGLRAGAVKAQQHQPRRVGRPRPYGVGTVNCGGVASAQACPARCIAAARSAQRCITRHGPGRAPGPSAWGYSPQGGCR